MKIVLISDTHCQARVLSKYFAICGRIFKKADKIVHLGDGIENSLPFLTDYPNANFVKGSHDDRNKTRRLSLRQKIEGVDVFFTHGDRKDKIREQINIWANKLRWKLFKMPPDLKDYYRLFYQRYKNKHQLVLYGHTHIPKIEKEENTVFFCPGGMSKAFFGFKPGIGLVVIKKLNNKTAKINCISYLINLEKNRLDLDIKKVYYVGSN